MSTITLPTPAELSITPRDRRFGRHSATPRLWHGGRVEATAIYNALSATFPAGEAFFVESVRGFRDGAPPKLAEEIRGFTTQEAIHSREHDAFNKRAADTGYDLSKLEAQVEKRLAVTRSKAPIVSLAATMALEHFTAILAHQLLADPRHLEGADKETADLWRWHAVEEIEHKGVAYDTWLYATRDWPRIKRWKVKARVMIYVTRNFLVDRTAGALELMRQDQVIGLRRLDDGFSPISGSGPACSGRSPVRGSNISCRLSILGTRTTANCSGAYAADAPATSRSGR